VIEDELKEYPDEGWEYMNEISDGKFVVRNPMANGVM